MSKTSYWFCPHCIEEIDPANVTFQELHDACGHPVEWIEGISIDRLREICEAEREGRLVVLPCKVGDTVDRLFSHNEIIAIWEEHKNEEASPKYMLWKGMAHALPMEYQSRVFVRIFGTIPESIMDADTVNILVTPCITPREEAEAALQKGEI